MVDSDANLHTQGIALYAAWFFLTEYVAVRIDAACAFGLVATLAGERMGCDMCVITIEGLNSSAACVATTLALVLVRRLHTLWHLHRHHLAAGADFTIGAQRSLHYCLTPFDFPHQPA